MVLRFSEGGLMVLRFWGDGLPVRWFYGEVGRGSGSSNGYSVT